MCSKYDLLPHLSSLFLSGITPSELFRIFFDFAQNLNLGDFPFIYGPFISKFFKHQVLRCPRNPDDARHSESKVSRLKWCLSDWGSEGSYEDAPHLKIFTKFCGFLRIYKTKVVESLGRDGQSSFCGKPSNWPAPQLIPEPILFLLCVAPKYAWGIDN